MALLPKAIGAESLNNLHSISLIGAIAQFYMGALTRLLRCKLGSCALVMYYRPIVSASLEGSWLAAHTRAPPPSDRSLFCASALTLRSQLTSVL